MKAKISLADPKALFAPLEEATRSGKERLNNDVRAIQDEFKKRGVDNWETSPDYRRRVGQRYMQYEYEIRSMLDEPMVDLWNSRGDCSLQSLGNTECNGGS